MPLPERYKRAVPEMVEIWEADGFFNAQTQVWAAQIEARSELEGQPDVQGITAIRQALVLSPDDIAYLNVPYGHETNRLLRLVQGRLPAELGNFIHKGNTSRDVLDTSFSLQILRSLGLISEQYELFAGNLLTLALEHQDTIQVSRTHGQHAVPQTFGRQALGWYAESERGLDRIERARQVIAYGKCSGEVGTHVFISPELEERALAKLGLKPEPVPTQLVSRDRHAEVATNMSLIGAGLARFANNIRTLARTEIGEVREPFKDDQQGSSAMPHKRNPELAERIVGLNRRIKTAAAEAVDTVGVFDEGDMSNSSIERFTFPDLFGCLSYDTQLADTIVTGLHVDTERMKQNLGLTYGAIYSPRLLNALLASGQISRTEAYDTVKSLALTALNQKQGLIDLARGNQRITGVISDEQITDLFSPDYYLRNIDISYQRLGIA